MTSPLPKCGAYLPPANACTAIIAFLAIACLPMLSLAQDDSKPEPKISVSSTADSLAWYIEELEKVDLEKIDNGVAYFGSRCCETLQAMGEEEKAFEFWEKAFQILSKRKSSMQFPLETALKLGRIDLAERCVADAGSLSNSWRDKIALAKYANGDEEALKDFPHGEKMLTFYNALELANTLVDMGRLDELEEFLSDLEISPENPPESVSGIIYKTIAKKARKTGDMDKAKKYIDKANDIGGNLYYTGFNIRNTHAAIHGKLMDDIERRAALGEAYRGHMARELLWSLVNELIQIQEFDAAIKVTERIEDEKDVQMILARIAYARAESGDYRGAIGMLRELKEANRKNYARLEIAKAMIRNGNEEGALSLIELAKPSLRPEKSWEDQYRLLAELGGMLHSEQIILDARETSEDEYERALRTLQALQGFKAMQPQGKESN
ncbi:MAG: hypothetical protein AAF483_05165 [Planctomycetota bacterium]